MPELPEVETVRRGLEKALLGKTITQVEQRREDLRAPLPANLPARLRGQKITALSRRGKYILIKLDSPQFLLIHLGMSGSLSLITDEKKKWGKHDHLIFHFGEKQTLVFNDPRRFGLCDLVPEEKLKDHPLLKPLGLEPLANEFTAEKLEEKLKGKKASIKAALMDQRIIAGLGNIYVCEALFYAGIDPQRRAGDIKRDEVAKLVKAIVKVLNKAIRAGGSSLRNYIRADGKLGSFQHMFAVYNREGKSCEQCGEKILRLTQEGRSTFYCPKDQK